MHWPSLSDNAESRLRIFLLGIAVIASVALPYAIVHRSAQSSSDAAALVLQSSEVKESVYQLSNNMREMENIVLELYVSMPSENAESAYRENNAHVAPLLEKLVSATRDNPEQQNRIGNLEAILKGRIKLLDTALEKIHEKNFDAAGEAQAQARELFPFRATSNEIVAAENQRFKQLSEQAEATRANARWAAIGVLFAQFALLGSVIFVSERQIQRRLNAEMLAQEAVAHSRAVVQTVREPIVVLDPTLKTVLTNRAFRESYGGDEEETGTALADLGEGAWVDPELSQRLLDVAARDRELWDFEMAQRDKDGIERIVLVNARRMALRGRDGDTASILLTVNDVTAKKRSEEQILALNRELAGKVEQVSEVNRELEAFSYSVSHDLRSPLRHIAGFAGKLDIHLGGEADEKAHHYLHVIIDAAQRMSSLIEDLLLYSRLGRSALRLQPLSMLKMAEETQAMLSVDIGERQIEWRIADLPTVVADETMMRQVWQNLLGNAVKYTSRREHTLIEVGVQPSDHNEIVFFVRDNGTGFDMDYAKKLFGVFQRLHKASEFPGTGIGLANVRRIITRHGGRTWAEAEPDKGATLYFSLPSLIAADNAIERIV